MKPLKIITLLIILIFNFSIVKADSYQTSSPYWSTVKDGPTTQQQAIDMFFKGRDLDPIEGIYTVPDWGLLAITKHKDGYRQYVIDIIFSGLNGTHETTYFKTSNPNVFDFFERISWEDGSWYKFKTSEGQLTLKDGGEFAENKFVESFIESNVLTKVWPKTLISTRSNTLEKFRLSEELSIEEKRKKLDTLTWYNWDNPKDHKTLLKKPNAEIYILENEYYLKGTKDINQYSWWIFGEENIQNNLIVFSGDQTIYVQYVDDGYVTIDDWKSINPEDLIAEMRKAQEDWKDELKKTGQNYIEELNWIYKPTFDSEKNAIYVSYEGSWNGKKGKYKSMQTNSIVLGRKGHLKLAFVTSITNETTKLELEQISNLAKDFTDGIDFLEGSKHADYKSGDKVAALGIGGLVAGTLGVKALAKVGILAKLAPFLMKFWWIIFAPIAAIIGLANKKKPNVRKRKRKEIDYD
jgi:uncharacterized membrane-anchored protein